ncbi:AraC family transcriptional regulator [Endozoicomonas sp. G2_1]|uniref:AraC family transcriptional regulator n=1 Tax=Endozoicomonas sp. G2_1 TaxID=2821091 RepID=UPI001AD9E8B4|nr:AraC family transcriptional regulator [Endozoicomonas sp. G2_1]MBO9488845.1 AraC family transcriptional regulator [Endozoicomonas sp. G2_1]
MKTTISSGCRIALAFLFVVFVIGQASANSQKEAGQMSKKSNASQQSVSLKESGSNDTNANDTNSNDTSAIANELASIKQQVLKLNRDLFILEEDLLFPASSQVSVFVSVDIGKFFSLDSVELKIDGKNVAGFLYTERQRKALEQGGIQGLYQGNIKKGEHELTAIFTGFDNEQRPIKRAANYQFSKDDEAVMIELKLEDRTNNYRAQVVVEEWLL